MATKRFFGLDMDYQMWFPQHPPDFAPEVNADGGWIRNEADYERLRPSLYTEPIPYDRDSWREAAKEQSNGEALIWFTLSGFFWWPRGLFGIAPHLTAFYDYPELMHRMNQDHATHLLHCIEDFCQICTPDFMTFAEDMSYNHGPMISKGLFDEFMAPYYRQLIPVLKERGINILIDSDGAVEPMIPWFEEVGIEGILPLERMAGVDVNHIREKHPKWKMIGGFDKTIMHLGEERMREEFERLLPVMKSGYFIPSVDHQTPPAVSLEDYRLYMKLLEEYTVKAVY